MLKTTLTILLVLLLAVNVEATYSVDFYEDGTGASPISTVNPSFVVNDSTCSLIMESFLTNFDNTLPTAVNIQYLSPSDTSIITGIETFTTNQSCTSFGVFGTSEISTNNTYESKTSLAHNSDDSETFSYLKTTYLCEEGPDLYYNVTIDSTTIDTRNNVANMYFRALTKVCSSPVPYTFDEFINFMNLTKNFGVCLNTEVSPLSQGTQITPGTDNCIGVMYYFPIRTGETGQVVYDLECSAFGTDCMDDAGAHASVTVSDKRWIIYDLNDQSTTTLSTDFTASGNVNLNPNTDYAIAFFKSVFDYTGSFIGFNAPIKASYDIFAYEPDYSECGEFSTCVNGTQFRICNDTNRVSPPIFEYRVCSLIAVENATLGFENFTTTSDVLKCTPDWNIFPLGCTYSIANITLDRPAGWTVVDPSYGFANFLQMSQEYATEGTRSLKMWQIPPKTGEVVDSTTCGNLTTSIIPQLFQGVSNTTFSVSHNVTFPAENMQVGFSVKKCNSQVLQHSALIDEGILFNTTLCNERCYGNSCSDEPRGRYAFNILDTTTSKSIFGVPQYRDAEIQSLSPLYDISNLGIVPGRTYNIVFAISNENSNDATGNCLYVDNVQYQVSNVDLEEFGCESQCFGRRRIEASRTQNGSCFFVIQENSKICSDSETAKAIENLEDYCEDGTILKTFIEKKADYDSVNCQEGFVCSPFPVSFGNPGSCISQEESTSQSTDQVTAQTLISEILSFLFSRFFWAITIIGLVVGVSSIAIARLSENPPWQPTAILGIITTIFFMGITWIPLEFGALMVMIIALLLVYEFRKAM